MFGFKTKNDVKVQHMDVGIITAAKVRYRYFKMDLDFDLIDQNDSNMYNIDIPTAKRSLKRMLEELLYHII